jgi:hypothetical protein
VVVAWSSNSNSNSGYNGGSSDDFDNGYTEGEKTAKNIWNDEYGSNGCESISSYNKKIQYYIDNKFSNNSSYSSSDLSKYSFNQGAAAGMKSVMKQYDSQCDSGGGGYDNNDFVDIASCSMVGQDMASQIAEGWSAANCGYSSLGVQSPGSYSKFGDTNDCITIATDECKGMMDQKLKTYCEKVIIENEYKQFVTMKGECKSKVMKIIKNAN